MKQLVVKVAVLLALVVSLVGGVAVPAYARGLKDQACDAAGTALVNNCNPGGGDGQAQGKVSSLTGDIINIFSLIVGAVSVIMIIVGGLRYVVSAGDTSGVQGAKNTIIYAIIGLIVVLFAQVIVRFVLSSAS